MPGFFFACPRSNTDSELLQRILRNQEKIMATLADIRAEVTALRSVEDSAIALMTGLSDQLKAAIAAQDPVALQQVVDDLDAGKTALAAAVAANTTPAPAPAPAPTQTPVTPPAAAAGAAPADTTSSPSTTPTP